MVKSGAVQFWFSQQLYWAIHRFVQTSKEAYRKWGEWEMRLQIMKYHNNLNWLFFKLTTSSNSLSTPLFLTSLSIYLLHTMARICSFFVKYYTTFLLYTIYKNTNFHNFQVATSKWALMSYWNSSYSFCPWIVSAHLSTVTFGLIYCDLWTSKFKKE